MDWTALYCSVDDFCLEFEPHWQSRQLATGERRRLRSRRLSISEIMTIVIAFHNSNYRNFKHTTGCYLHSIRQNSLGLSATVALSNSCLPCWGHCVLTCSHCFGTCMGVSFIDSTSIVVCGNKQITLHQTLKAIARRVKTTMGLVLWPEAPPSNQRFGGAVGLPANGWQC